jgi:hypothetical protein
MKKVLHLISMAMINEAYRELSFKYVLFIASFPWKQEQVVWPYPCMEEEEVNCFHYQLTKEM